MLRTRHFTLIKINGMWDEDGVKSTCGKILHGNRYRPACLVGDSTDQLSAQSPFLPIAYCPLALLIAFRPLPKLIAHCLSHGNSSWFLNQ